MGFLGFDTQEEIEAAYAEGREEAHNADAIDLLMHGIGSACSSAVPVPLDSVAAAREAGYQQGLRD